ncbi:hypothetical protein HanLR1_Chr15g0581931 [Helianthus annuus]|nr:hypothetical protein HanLR1_Chr15g0581931 [Helianthus annuus]
MFEFWSCMEMVLSSSLVDRSFSLRGLNWRSIVRGSSLARTRLRKRILDFLTFANNSHLSKKVKFSLMKSELIGGI